MHSARFHWLHNTCVAFVCTPQSAAHGTDVLLFLPCVFGNGVGLPLVGPLETLVFVVFVVFWLIVFGNPLRLLEGNLCEPFLSRGSMFQDAVSCLVFDVFELGPWLCCLIAIPSVVLKTSLYCLPCSPFCAA